MHNLKVVFLTLALALLGQNGYSQEMVDGRVIDNNLSFEVISDQIKEKGVFTFCIIDTSRGYCVENLRSGVEVKAYNKRGEEIWMGIGSGRSKTLKLAKALPEAYYLVIKAFKPHVVNVSNGHLIHQEKPIEIKYFIK